MFFVLQNKKNKEKTKFIELSLFLKPVLKTGTKLVFFFCFLFWFVFVFVFVFLGTENMCRWSDGECLLC